MSVAELIAEARQAGAELFVDGTALRVRAPRGALGPELRARLSAEREAILAVLASARASATAESIPAFPVDEPAPLSHAQERLWFLDRLNPTTAFLNLPVTLRLHGPLDVDALRWSVTEIGHRHDALRTAVVSEHGEPRQLVQPLDLELEIEDFAELSEPERTAAWMTRRATELTRPFAAERAPLIRFLLLRSAPDDHVLVFVASHLVFDGWSHDIVFRELKALYEARISGGPIPPGPSVRFADFVRWQRARLDSGVEQPAIERIKARLSGMPGTLELGTDHPRPAEPSNRGTRHVLELDRELVARLRRVAVAHGATLNMLALATIELLVARFANQSDFGIGVPSRGRTRPDSEGVIGMFVNTLVLRSDVPAGGRFSDLLERVKDSSLDALADEEIPFEALVQALRPARERNRTPLFQVMFSYQEASARLYRIADVELEQIPSYSGSSAYELTFWLRDHGTTAFAAIEISSDLFTPATGEWLCACWLDVLQTIAEDPKLPLERISLPARTVEPTAARNDVEQALLEIWKRALHLDLGVDDDFFDMGGTSLRAVEIFDQVRARFGAELPISVLFEHRTVERLAEALMPEGRRSIGLWNTVVPLQPSGAAPPLFCVPDLGGNPLHLRHLASALGTAQPFYGLQYRGVDGRRVPHRSIVDLGREFAADIVKVAPHGRHRIAGCGGGGLAAYEVAQRLRAAGHEVELLILLGTPCPGKHRPTIAARLSAELSDLVSRPNAWASHVRDGAGCWVASGRRAWAVRRAPREPFRYRNDVVLEASLVAERLYRPLPYDGDVLVIAPSDAGTDAASGWRDLVRGSLEVEHVQNPGRDLTDQAHAAVTATAVDRALARARAGRHA